MGNSYNKANLDDVTMAKNIIASALEGQREDILPSRFP